MQNPGISVIVAVYNHEKYIKQCLDSIVMQNDCPNFEIIIGNDCSTDDSAKIIAEYAEKYTDLIKVLPREHNLGLYKNVQDCLKCAKGEFIAFCEGDDFWTNRYKLKMQYDILKSNENYNMCAFKVDMLSDCANVTVSDEHDYRKFGKKIFSDKDFVALMNPTANFSACMYKSDAIKHIPKEYYEMRCGADWLFNIYATRYKNGKCCYIDVPASVYRQREGAIWSSLSANEKFFEIISFFPVLYKLFQDDYVDECAAAIEKLLDEKNCKKNIFELRAPISTIRSISIEINKYKKKS